MSRMTTYQWALHFVSEHKTLSSRVPSLEEMLKYPDAFAQMARDHQTLHLRFHTGHEHDKLTGMIVAPAKPKAFFEVIDD